MPSQFVNQLIEKDAEAHDECLIYENRMKLEKAQVTQNRYAWECDKKKCTRYEKDTPLEKSRF